MSEMKFSLPGQETVTLAGQTVDKLIRAGNGDAALLYLYILKTHGQSSSGEAAAAMGKGAGWIADAMAVLSRLGLVNLDDTPAPSDLPDRTGEPSQPVSPISTKKKDEPSPRHGSPQRLDEYDYDGDYDNNEPHRHSVKDMKRELETGSVFYALVEAAQGSLGKIMSPEELLRLFGIYESLRMEPEVILQLITHCITESHGRSGGRMPSMRYIEKVAYAWAREGIFTLDKAEAYLKAHEARKSDRGEIKRALQIRDREFSETEKRYVDNWITMGFGAAAVAIAYDRTLVITGKLAWGYMDKIINNWHSKGIHTPQEIAEKDRKADKSAFNNTKSSDQKFGAADLEDIERMKRLLNKIKED